MPNYVYLVRHGETEFNNKEIMHGQYDVPLNQLGIKQAKLLGLELRDVHFDVCFCSPLSRAKDTAKEIMKYHTDVPVIYDDRLMEIYMGNLENTTNHPPNYMLDEELELLKKHDFESHAHFFTRVKSLLDEITDEYVNKDILIVAHCGTVRMSMIYFDPPNVCIEDMYYDLKIKNCSVQRVLNNKPERSPILVTYDVSKEDWPNIALYED